MTLKEYMANVNVGVIACYIQLFSVLTKDSSLSAQIKKQSLCCIQS